MDEVEMKFTLVRDLLARGYVEDAAMNEADRIVKFVLYGNPMSAEDTALYRVRAIEEQRSRMRDASIIARKLA